MVLEDHVRVSMVARGITIKPKAVIAEAVPASQTSASNGAANGDGARGFLSRLFARRA
jgi:hypothetical protein